MFNIPNKPTSGNGVSANECKEYMITLEKELEKVLKCKPSMRGMKNMGTNLIIIIIQLLVNY
jgi:hypothetical protein